MQINISQLGLLKLHLKTIFRITYLISLSFILLLSSAVFTPLIACTLCVDSITLFYIPGVDLLSSILFIYIFGRCISAFFGTRKMSWKRNALVFLILIILAFNFGNLNALMIITVYFIIKHTWQIVKFNKHFGVGEKVDLTLLIILMISLCVAYEIGKERETDDQWLLNHIGMRASSELYYQRLGQLPHIPSLCDYMKKVASNSYTQEVKIGWLSRLASDKKQCKEELVYLYTKKKSEYLLSVYTSLIFMSDPHESIWIELCKDHSFFDRSYDNKGWITRLDEARTKVKLNCPSF